MGAGAPGGGGSFSAMLLAWLTAGNRLSKILLEGARCGTCGRAAVSCSGCRLCQAGGVASSPGAGPVGAQGLGSRSGSGARRARGRRHHGGQRGVPHTRAVSVSAPPCPCPCPCPDRSADSRPGASWGLPRRAAAACSPVLPGAAGPGWALTPAAPPAGSAVLPVPLNISQPLGSGELQLKARGAREAGRVRIPRLGVGPEPRASALRPPRCRVSVDQLH